MIDKHCRSLDHKESVMMSETLRFMTIARVRALRMDA